MIFVLTNHISGRDTLDLLYRQQSSVY